MVYWDISTSSPITDIRHAKTQMRLNSGGFTGNIGVFSRPVFDKLCGPDEECPDRAFRCRRCGYSAQTELDGCPACGADWKAIDVSHGPGCPKNLLEEAMDTANGGLVRRCFRILNAKSFGLTITPAHVTEEEFRVLELIEAERQ